MKPLNELDALSIRRGVETGDFSAHDVARACLDRIDHRNGEIQAVAAFDREAALAYATALDAMPSHRVLHGVPFGVKDVLDTVDLPTTYGSPIYAGHRTHADASCIALSKQEGALLLGKTVTCEFATHVPSRTRNPLAPSHTPGGSSSGSAAAVADYQMPVAFGTQTSGSTIRPAAYCGIVGYKPTYGLINVSGLKPLRPTVDTISVLARTVADASFFVFGMSGARFQLVERLGGIKVGICRSTAWDDVHPYAVEAIDRFCGRIASAGTTVTEVRMPREVEALDLDQRGASGFGLRHSLAHEYQHHPEKLSPILRSRMDEGKGFLVDDYLEFESRAGRARLQIEDLFREVDVLLYPSADGEAPAGLDSTGSFRFCGIWSLLHVPCVGFPIAAGSSGLPLGVQVIGPRGSDRKVLAIAQALSRSGEFQLPRPV
jgi:Asp-tRNA(Asn)/Glu-tRNA(Gln) amidotransferase A subunit family amidase